MSKVLSVLVAFLVFSSVAFASQPGQPLDCTDFVLASGYSCSAYMPLSADTNYYCDWINRGGNKVVDNQGRLLIARWVWDNQPGDFGEVQIVVNDGTGEQIIARVHDRIGPTFEDHIRTSQGCEFNRCDPYWPVNYCDSRKLTNTLQGTLVFDAVGGRLLVALINSNARGPNQCYTDNTSCGWIAAIGGFASLYDIAQSYIPTTQSFGFSVPAIPEGLRCADRFDTYTGDVVRPLDFSQAQPLQCNYPTTTPSAGDYFTFPASGMPTPGHARYYLTSVTCQGQTRAGRKALDGRLSGRDASQLPPCVFDEEFKR